MTNNIRLNSGDAAPNFSLQDQHNKIHTLSDYSNKKLIIYFYPAASTPGCTIQACDFRDNLASLKSHGYEIIGVSPDKLEDQSKFTNKHHLDFPLLCDTNLEMHKAYATWGEKNLYGKKITGVIRSTFVINESGIIDLALYNVKATGHVKSLKKKLNII